MTFLSKRLVTGNFGSNGALWSLAYEWWYYCIFALIGFAFCNEGNKRFLCIALALVISVLLPNKIILWGAVWLLGVFAYKWFSSNKWKPDYVSCSVTLDLAIRAA